jgi:glutamate-1-semialdehyde 2,1-aminomutase
MLFGVKPDIAVFAKALSNGYPMAAIIGRANAMQAAQKTFISSTYWTDRVGPAAALATVRKFRRCNVSEHLIRVGNMIQKGWKEAAGKCSLPIEVGGIPPLSHFSFAGEEKQAAKTLFIQLMLERGFLATTAFYAAYAHQEAHIDSYLENVNHTFPLIREALETNTVRQQLRGPLAHTGFSRLT